KKKLSTNLLTMFRFRCEYPSYDVPEQLETPLLEPKNTNTSSSSTQPEALTHDILPVSSLGGPFQSLQEAENAITSHLDELRSPMMCTDGLSDAEIGILHALHWPDGTRKKSSKGNAEHRNISLLVQALLDKYNEDHHLLGVYSLSLLPALTPGPLTRIVLFVLIFMF
uniref:Uncharacterized protein n=1 Tax=Aegilops tauschii subsp. strangulata TaxID=200361 RepID=A0A453IRX0_AEGTS